MKFKIHHEQDKLTVDTDILKRRVELKYIG